MSARVSDRRFRVLIVLFGHICPGRTGTRHLMPDTNSKSTSRHSYCGCQRVNIIAPPRIGSSRVNANRPPHPDSGPVRRIAQNN